MNPQRRIRKNSEAAAKKKKKGQPTRHGDADSFHRASSRSAGRKKREQPENQQKEKKKEEKEKTRNVPVLGSPRSPLSNGSLVTSNNSGSNREFFFVGIGLCSHFRGYLPRLDSTRRGRGFTSLTTIGTIPVMNGQRRVSAEPRPDHRGETTVEVD